MHKHIACRAALVAANPEFADEPDRLKVFVDKGRIVSRRTPGLGYETRYRLTIYIEEFAHSADRVMVPILLWLRDAQPERLLEFEREDQAIQFEAEILDNDKANLLVEFELTEAASVTIDSDGNWSVTAIAEPSPDKLPLVDGVPTLGQLLGIHAVSP